MTGPRRRLSASRADGGEAGGERGRGGGVVEEDAQAGAGGAGDRDVDGLGGLGEELELVAFERRLDGQDDAAAGLEVVAGGVEDVGEHPHLVEAGGVGEAHEGEAGAAGGLALVERGDGAGDLGDGGGGAGGLAEELGVGQHALAAERAGVVVERVAGEVEADGLVLLRQPLHRRPVVGLRQARGGQGVRSPRRRG